MNLRIRSLQTGESLTMKLPDQCSLLHLKHLICETLPTKSVSSSSLRLSLNRLDELQASSPHVPLLSLGIVSGDLIFFSSDPHAFSNPHVSVPQQTLVQRQSPQVGEFDVVDSEIDAQVINLNIRALERVDTNSDMSAENSKQVIPNLDSGHGETLNNEMNVIESSGTGDYVQGEGFSVTGFLGKVLIEEFGVDRGDQRLLVIAVHAIILESGFIPFDSSSGSIFDRFHLSEITLSLSQRYTLPELAIAESGIETVIVKFQHLRKFLNVYGSLDRSGSGVHRLCLDEYRILPSLTSLWRNNLSDMLSSSQCDILFEFWKIIKDELALPLMISICETSGLDYPPCLMRLPTELKLKILESLPGNCIGMMACVCREFLYLSRHGDLWRQKCLEEFGKGERDFGWTNWKDQWKALFCKQKSKANASEISYPYDRLPVWPMSHNHQFPIRADHGLIRSIFVPPSLMQWYVHRRAHEFGMYVGPLPF